MTAQLATTEARADQAEAARAEADSLCADADKMLASFSGKAARDRD